MTFVRIFSILIIAFSLLPARVFASEGTFSYVYTAETTPAGSYEYEQKHSIRTGKARGNYLAIGMRNEFEYGITDRLQGAFYLNSSYLNTQNQYDPEDVSQNFPDRNEFDIDSVSAEFIYRVLSPFKDGLGLAFYLEPELGVRDPHTGEDRIERAIEARLILQKNFLDDQMVTAFNLMLEPEWERVGGQSAKELFAELTFGAAYRFTEKWFAGLELRNHMEFPDFDLACQEHSAYFMGPTLHYGAESYWWTLTVMPQIAGSPSDLGTGADGQPLAGHGLHLGQHEKLEVRFAFGLPFGGEQGRHE